MSGGQGYYSLKSILDAQRADEQQYYSLPPDACPNCGTPLEIGQNGIRNCPMGHYTFTGGRRLT